MDTIFIHIKIDLFEQKTLFNIFWRSIPSHWLFNLKHFDIRLISILFSAIILYATLQFGNINYFNIRNFKVLEAIFFRLFRWYKFKNSNIYLLFNISKEEIFKNKKYLKVKAYFINLSKIQWRYINR